MATWDRYTDKTTSFEVSSYVGDIWVPRFFCDDADTTFATKPPVSILKLTPTTQFDNTNIAWDISESDSATGTVDTFDITWGGTTDAGDIADGDWDVDSLTGNIQYTTNGTYTVTATVTDTLGAISSPAKITVNIVDYVSLDTLYIGTTDGGVYKLTPSSGPDAINTGLSGTQLNVRAVRVHPGFRALTAATRHLWAATEAGVMYSTDNGTTWNATALADLGTPTNTAADGTPPVTGDLDQIDIAFDPQDAQRVYLFRTTATRAWVYYTTDYGITWSNIQVGTID